MPITINGTNHPDGSPLTIGGVQASEVTVNGTTAWRNIVDVTVPQQSGLWNLKTIIQSAVDSGATNIRVTNTLIQPAMESGDLTGLVVELVNTGEIQASQSSGTAMSVTTAFKLTNNGWIKGGGGKGGTGATGAKGADSNSTAWTIHWVQGSYMCGNYNLGLGYIFDGYNEFQNSSDCSNFAYYPNDTTARTMTYRKSVFGSCETRASKLYRRGAYRTTANGTEMYDIEVGVTTYYTGGAGGTGGVGGNGQYFNATAQPGVGGNPGQPSTPAGGNSGSTGYTGGAGGTFGVAGLPGAGGGSAGIAPGYAIIGQSLLTGDSDIGQTLGLLGNLY